MIKYNQSFKSKYLADLDANVELPDALLDIINSGFVKHSDNCIFYTKLQPLDCLDKNNNFYDKTEMECWYNEIRLSNYICEYLNLLAPKFAFAILDKLNREFSDLQFELIISYDEFESDLDITIKLHTIREEDTPYICIDKLDNFEQPILVIRS